ncbi:MAG: glycosyltransferase, partial [Bacteroidota bacterium]
ERVLHLVAQKTREKRDLFRWENITRQYLQSIDDSVHVGTVVIQHQPIYPQRVMIIWTKFLPYHIARIKHLKKRLDEIGCALTAVEVASQDELYPFGKNFEDNAIDYISCFTHTSYRELSARRIFDKVFEMLNHFKPDVVFAPATPFPSGMASARYRLENNNRSILMDDAWDHSDKRGRVIRWFKKNIHQNIDGAFIPAPSHASYYRDLGFERDRLVFGVDVVDNAFFSARAEAARAARDDIRARLRLPEKYFLFVGRLLPIKGTATLLKAYQRYRKNASNDAWALVFVGDGQEGRKIENESDQCPGIYAVGTKTSEELCLYYGLASALVMPSDTETWGLVVNEAMASGLPVIVSKGCGCATSLVQDGKNGWTFGVRDADMLAGLMKQCSSLSQQELEAMGKKSLELIHGLSLDTFADGVIAALSIPRRRRADMVPNIITNLWTGRISFYP